MMIVVSYDVSTISAAGRKRLRKIAKECANFGIRVQNSVFECHLDPALWTTLKLRLLGLFKAEEDSLRFYYMGSNWRGDVEHHGTKAVADPNDALFG
jgi:CRISPR-associated protein Cas2